MPAMAYVKERLQAMLSEVATKFPFFMRQPVIFGEVSMRRSFVEVTLAKWLVS